jgi:predicted Ser/Thr protein kinase
MSRLTRLAGKSKEIDLEGEKFILSPLKGKDLSLFSQEDMTKEQKLDAMYEIVRLSLVDNLPDVTKDEIKNLDLRVIEKIMESINELNGFIENESAIRKIKEQIIRK